MRFSNIAWVSLNFPLCWSIQVFKTDSNNSQPNSAVEILESELQHLEQFTLCGRFKTPFLSSMPNIWQNLIYKSNFWIFGKFLAKITPSSLKIEANANAQLYKIALGKRHLAV